MCHVLAQCQAGLQDHATPWHSTAPPDWGKRHACCGPWRPATELEWEQLQYPFQKLFRSPSACLCPSETPIRTVKTSQTKQARLPGNLPSIFLFRLPSMLLAVGDREGKGRRFQTLLPSLLPICLLPAGQETPETLRNTHLPTCAPEGLQQGAGTVMNDHRGWSGQAGVETSLQRSKSQTADLAARPVTWFGIPALWL